VQGANARDLGLLEVGDSMGIIEFHFYGNVGCGPRMIG
jgi:hypothetical protein